MNLELAGVQEAQRPDTSGVLLLRLTETLRTETRLLGTLSSVLETQRRAVAENDLAGVESSVHSVERVLLTLREARRTRSTILARLGLEGVERLTELRRALGPAMTPDLEDQIDQLASLARSVDARLKVNGQLIQRAMEQGDQMLRRVYAPSAPATSYPSPSGPRGNGESLLIDRRI